ncbi:hypothetical protein AVEN_173256-1 [Araneus ventricosus]|uniref:Uncharacterized protein n=1 Tax=Araneus ventricosus TaxID=182803 RepID=A0A4Y2HFQ2_ARAVE|nr:hypothetical protein AVEN_173256-1 [Araneus ventricosus]
MDSSIVEVLLVTSKHLLTPSLIHVNSGHSHKAKPTQDHAGSGISPPVGACAPQQSSPNKISQLKFDQQASWTFHRKAQPTQDYARSGISPPVGSWAPQNPSLSKSSQLKFYQQARW